MRIRGTFIRSRLVRRVFWGLLVAALLPLALFGQLVHHHLDKQQVVAQHQAEAALVREAGMRLFDRLQAARSVLAADDGGGALPLPDPADARSPARMLLGINETPPGPWSGAALEQGLVWVADAAGSGARIKLRHALPDGAVREAEVNPAYLWADLGPDGSLAGVCVLASAGQPLFCPDGEARATGARWELFLRGGFGSPDWTLAAVSNSGLPLTPLPMEAAMTPALVATMLLAAVIGLMLVRRLLGPIEQLSSATRELAAGRWSARVVAQGDDELAGLARSFNTMAARLQRQVDAMDVQSAIDREILGRLDLDTVLGQVAARLAALAPGGRVMVLARRPGLPVGRDWQAWMPGLARARDLPPEHVAALPVADGQWQPRQGAPPAWCGSVCPGPAPRQLDWAAAHWQAERVALLVVEGGLSGDDADITSRELRDLRDRVAVTLAAAVREHSLLERARHDSLTGLLNRDGLREAGQGLLASGPAALVFVDLDDFKQVNDTLGHEAGDRLLCAVAGRLRRLLPPGGVLARQGGDEFVLLVPGGPEAAQALCDVLCTALAEPFALASATMAPHTVHAGASLGLACAPEDGTELMLLMRRADLALYAAKAAGRGRWQRHTPGLDADAAERAWLQRELRLALAGQTLELHYQPRLDMATGDVASVEALVRWRHAQRGWVRPDQFIPVAESSGLIDALGDWVLRTGLAQMRRWRDAGTPVGCVAVNVSARQLRREDFAAGVLAAVAEAGLQPGDLELELTESLFAGDVRAVCARLGPLRAAGVRVALDDFGTGYSSLSALQSLPIDTLKIDRSFVAELGQRESADAVARTVVALGRALGKRVTAEGVETALQEQHLLALGCDEVQGWRYARAEPAEACTAVLLAGFAAPRAAVQGVETSPG
jgi:diguanylate cyclase